MDVGARLFRSTDHPLDPLAVAHPFSPELWETPAPASSLCVPRIALSLVVTHSIPELPAYQPNAWPPLADTDEHAATLQSTVADLGVMQSALASTGNSFDVLSVASAICCRCRCCCFCCRSSRPCCVQPQLRLPSSLASLARSLAHLHTMRATHSRVPLPRRWLGRASHLLHAQVLLPSSLTSLAHVYTMRATHSRALRWSGRASQWLAL
jgi:hypothetical protein